MSKKPKINAPEVGDTPMHMPEGGVTPSEEITPFANGPIILLLIILLLSIFVGMFYWYTILRDAKEIPVVYTRPTAEENNEPESTTAEAEVETIQAVSTSDEIGAIEADLDSTNMDSLDAELNAIDAELETQ